MQAENNTTIEYIIVTYNRERELKLTLERILAQTCQARQLGLFRLIVIDNASTDGTNKYLMDLSRRDLNRVKLKKSTKNEWIFKHFIDACQETKATHVCLFGDDDFLTDCFFERLIQTARAESNSLLLIARQNFTIDSEVNFDSQSASGQKEICGYWERDRHHGFLGSVVYPVAPLKALLDEKIENNNYLNKFFAWKIALEYGFQQVPDVLCWKRCPAEGSYFMKDPVLELKTFFLDQRIIFLRLARANPILSTILFIKTYHRVRYIARIVMRVKKSGLNYKDAKVPPTAAFARLFFLLPISALKVISGQKIWKG